VTRPLIAAHWRDLVLVTFAVPDRLAATLVPAGCDADRWDGRCYVSLVALCMERVRVRGWAIPGLTAYPQVNLRFYVRHAGRAAVRFIREIVPSHLLAAAARWWYGEPFRTGYIRTRRTEHDGTISVSYHFGLDRPRWHVAVRSATAVTVPEPASFAHWLKERSRGCRTGRHGRLRTFDVAHPPWGVRAVRSADVSIDFGALYGTEWRVIDGQSPASVVHATGSDVTVSAPA
jgi:uncharacterized protein